MVDEQSGNSQKKVDGKKNEGRREGELNIVATTVSRSPPPVLTPFRYPAPPSYPMYQLPLPIHSYRPKAIVRPSEHMPSDKSP